MIDVGVFGIREKTRTATVPEVAVTKKRESMPELFRGVY